ncbi:flagellar hook-basal body complex protein [Vagococcus salmoninarum]|uniref:Flagellar hook protein FlgE n=1 Tax=Vagococcus salmoninarum TaxID=2739 RepID=A0A429ZSV7_9ENTE|nr:flagellar hook-basal body complex protein [Vagococcus salmoninarum]RST96807.1 flagellar basal body rod protein FlgG [Vagococcus salmoninarum]
MLKSLYSGVSGMKSLQTKMDVVSNNIANVNTVGFKAGRVRFQDLLSQTDAGAQGPTANGNGGINARQVGLGVKVGSIDTMMGAGTPQPTGRPLDFALDAGGFFILQKNDEDQTKYYTRDGGFVIDSQGKLTNADGFAVMGRGVVGDELVLNDKDFTAANNLKPLGDLAPIEIKNKVTVGGKDLDLVSYSIDGSGMVTGKYSDNNTYVIGQISLATFSNPDGLEKMGGNNYVQSGNSGDSIIVTAGTEGSGMLVQGALEGSNVDLANEFTEMIIASRAYQANSRSISTSDEMLQELINLKR